MAKQKVSRGQASDAIRGVLESGANSTADIKAALSAKGIDASNALIGSVRAKWKKDKGLPLGRWGGRRKKRRAAGKRSTSLPQAPAPATKAASNGDTLDSAILFVRSAGSLEKARRILAQLAEIKAL